MQVDNILVDESFYYTAEKPNLSVRAEELDDIRIRAAICEGKLLSVMEVQ